MYFPVNRSYHRDGQHGTQFRFSLLDKSVNFYSRGFGAYLSLIRIDFVGFVSENRGSRDFCH